MQSPIATGCRIVRSGWLLPALMMLAACTDPARPVAASATSDATPIARDNSASGGTHSVDEVSDALGQRLDTMLSSGSTSTTH